jgi:hypothetical protein
MSDVVATNGAASREEPTKRPRLWVPGTLVVTAEGELVAGAHAGFNGYGKDFAASMCGHAGSMRDWRHCAWMVKRSDLDDDALQQHAIILPETLLDPAQQPFALRWLASQPLVCVSGLQVAGLLDGGLRVYTVAYGAEEDDAFAVSAEGGSGAQWSLRLPFRDLLPTDLRPEGDTLARLQRLERLDARTFVDRILSEISGGALRNLSVVNALAARKLIEPGYGYRGATHGEAASLEDVADGVAALNHLFAQVYRRAHQQRRDAEQIARTISQVAATATTLGEIPLYASARKVTLEAMRIPMTPGAYVHTGVANNTLTLPAQARWFVDRVAMWRPSSGRGRALAVERVPGEGS